MTKFSIGASQKQAKAATKACNNLKDDVDKLMKKVNSFGEENFEGAAADNAQQYAETVIMPLLRGASALYEDIPIAMKRLPGEYEGKVDHKSWSTEELEAKIKQYEQAAKKAEKAAKDANNVAKKAESMGVPGSEIMATAFKCVTGFEKCIASAQKVAARYKKILKNLNHFDVFSSTIFDEIDDLEKNLKKGQKIAGGAYNSQNHSFSIPKKDELDWAEDLDETYEGHHLAENVKKIILNSQGKIHSVKWGLKNGKVDCGKAYLGYKDGKFKLGESTDEIKLSTDLNDIVTSSKLSLLSTRFSIYNSINPDDFGVDYEGHASILHGEAKSKEIDASVKGDIGEINGKIVARKNKNGVDIGFEGDYGLANGSLGLDRLNASVKGPSGSKLGIDGRLSFGAQSKIQAEYSHQKIGNLGNGTYTLYQDNLNLEGMFGIGMDVNVKMPIIRRTKFSSDKSQALVEKFLDFYFTGGIN